MLMCIIILVLTSGCINKHNYSEGKEDCEHYKNSIDYRQCVNCKETCENLNLSYGKLHQSLFRVVCMCLKDGEFISTYRLSK